MKFQASLQMLAFAIALFACGTHQGSATHSSRGPRSASPSAATPPLPTVASAAAAEPSRRVRQPALAGSWYPRERTMVVVEAQRMLRAAALAPTLSAKPIALVVPHAGWRFSGTAAAAAFRTLHRGDFARVVLLGPSHEVAFDGFSLADVDSYRTPFGEVPLCPEAASLRDDELVSNVAGADAREHSIEIEVPLLQQTLGAFCLVPIVVGQTTQAMDQALAAKLAGWNDGHTLFVFSSDFTHYGPRFEYTPFGPSAIDAHDKIVAQEKRAIDLLATKDGPGFRQFIASTQDTICGRHGLYVLLDLLPRIAPHAQATVLAHYGSTELGDAADDNGVWYVALGYVENGDGATRTALPMGAPAGPAICQADSPPLDAAAGQALVRVARAALQTELQGTDDLGRELAALPRSHELDRIQAVFVTLTKQGELRGCVGQVQPEYVLPEAVVVSAIDAALHDTRFEPVTAAELSSLSLEVTALTPPRAVGSWQDIELGKHGIVLQHGTERALFLPQVPGEQGWTLEQTLEALSHKAGLPGSAWRSADTKFSVFTGQVFDEPKPAAGAAAPQGAK